MTGKEGENHMRQTPTQQQNISGAVQAIRSAENVLTAQINSATDTLTAIKLTNAYNHLDSCLSQLLHAQNVTDDATFASAMAAIKSQESGLQSDERALKDLISDVDTAAKVVGYIGQALSFIGRI